MFEPLTYLELGEQIRTSLENNRGILDQLRAEIRPLRSQTRRIQPRATTAISLVATDGGNNKLQFDPFLLQIVRVVDSSNNEYCLEVVTPTTSVRELSARHFLADGKPITPLGEMMAFLGVATLDQLSPMIAADDASRPRSPSWVQVYRELVEWSILFSIVREKDFGTDTLLVFDGLLRSMVFARGLFARLLDGITEAIDKHKKNGRRTLSLVGIAKKSQVLTRYRLAMALEEVLACGYPAYVEVPRDIQEKAYLWTEYARGNDRYFGTGEVNTYAGGKMFFIKFGSAKRDPIWPIDVFEPQTDQAGTIFGHLLADAIEGFPIPLYPRSLQRAHENAALVDFDFNVLQDHIFAALRGILGSEASALDIFRLQDLDPAQQRYGQG